jgi:hypothetical protein
MVLRIRGTTRLIRKRTKKTKNKILAIPAAVPAMPPNPKAAAINATIKKVSAQLNISHLNFLMMKLNFAA